MARKNKTAEQKEKEQKARKQRELEETKKKLAAKNKDVEESEDRPEDSEEPEGEELDYDDGCSSNEDLQRFLQKWDRDIDPSRRVYGIKVLFAGVESEKFREGVYRIGIRHILVSYFYMRKFFNKASVQQVADMFGKFDYVMLDSGGFTFIQARNEGKNLGVDTKEYADEYYENLKRFGHLFAGCAEVDLRQELGYPYMEEKQKEMLDHGITLLPIIQGDEIAKYEGMGWFDCHHYIGVGSKLLSDKWAGYRQQLYDIGKKKGIVYHGLAATSVKFIQRSQFYSVDSTTWLGGAQFGNTLIFKNGRIKYYDMTGKEVRKRYRQRFEENGLIWADIEADKYMEVNLMNALAWKQYSEYIRYNALKSYWLTADEKDQALELKSKAFNAEGLMNRSASIRRADFRRVSQVEDPSYDDRAHEVLYCDQCNMAGRCPRYKPKGGCGYDINVRLETKLDIQKAMQLMLEVQHGRVMTGVLFEKLEGGVIDKHLSNEIKQYMEMAQDLRGLYDPPPQEELTLRAKGGQGSLANMLASVFQKTGTGSSGSGNTYTERAANKELPEDSELEAYDVEGLVDVEGVPIER